MPLELFALLPLIAAALLGTERPPRREAAEEEFDLFPYGPRRPGLLSHEQLVAHCRRLAQRHRLAPEGRRGRDLLGQVRADAERLQDAYRAAARAADQEQVLLPSSEWLLDNFHLVEDQIAYVRKHLPARYYRELPKLADGALVGFPRVYALALEILAHSDALLDEETLAECVRAYQSDSALQMGELWAIPIMLRIGLLAGLARLVEPLAAEYAGRAAADAFADRVLELATYHPEDVPALVGELSARRDSLGVPFIVRLLQRLRGRGHPVQPILDWIERYLADAYGTRSEELVREETRRRAADQVSIRNIITSFRLIDTIRWDAFFERTSRVEEILRDDPAGVYARCDATTRDLCRHALEAIARRCPHAEEEVARQALALAHEAASDASADDVTAMRRRHIGYYLIGPGRTELEARVRSRPTLGTRLYRWVTAHPTLVYLGSIGGLTALFVALATRWALARGATPALAALAAAVTLLPASDLAVALVNRILTSVLPLRRIPKLDLSAGVPDDCRTLVAIPVLLSSSADVEEMLQRLEVHYLSNPDPNLHFALLTDFVDADECERPEDTLLLHQAAQGIVDLNARYEGESRFHRFLLLHRPRRWNPCQGKWMGWERKRGKFVELNRLLLGEKGTNFTTTIGDVRAIRGTRYVICLDADTRLPAGAARRLVGAMAHPLNRPVVDPLLGRVVDGYAVLQPRVSIALSSAARTWFTRIFSGRAGVDPYTTAVSDVYQDLFGEGIFCGKGIYEVATFHRVLEGRVGDNQLLSHDLFEGCFARCGLVTDVEFFDDYPSKYHTYSARQHRWIRGDWQLLRWLAPVVRQADGVPRRNPLSIISRWKIFDNLRRSLSAPGLLLLFAAGWVALPGSPWTWTTAGLVVAAFPIFAHLSSALIVDPRAVPWGSYFWGAWHDTVTNIQQTALTLTFLAHQAWNAGDAIVRTLWRMFVSHRNLLEWQTAADTERRLGTDLPSFVRRMWPAPALAGALGGAVLLAQPAAMVVAAPLLVAWLLSPVVAYLVSLPAIRPPEPLAERDERFLRTVARKTWRFFQETVTERDHWLPPDNYQPDREPALAHRTSPTNLGLFLLSMLSARDLGYAGLHEVVDRLERTLATMERLQRFRGHFYNWYDTLQAQPIPPLYVSTVDSGNLAGALIALKQAALEMQALPVFGPQTVAGVRDTLAALRAELPPGSAWLRPEIEALERSLAADPFTGPEWRAWLIEVEAAAARLRDQAFASEPPTPPIGAEVRAWCDHLVELIRELRRDLDTLIPWAEPLTIQPEPFGDEQPLIGDVSGRRFVFADLVDPPGRRSRGLDEFPDLMERALAELHQLRVLLEERSLPETTRTRASEWLDRVERAFERCRDDRVALLCRLDQIARRCDRFVAEMEFSFLYDERRDLFCVGYDVSTARLDAYHYDLLASECRLASLVAIAKHDVPQRHWFALRRSLTGGRDRALLSWSGTLFEYLMPVLLMRAYPGTLLGDTLPAVVRHHQRYAARHGVPWGISESGYSARDAAMNYQYRAFGVPGLGLRPELETDLVVAPYASALALPIAPRDAVQNLRALAREGMLCSYGFYEAIDYTPARLQRGQRAAIVRQLMAHHQGMILVSVANVLTGYRMQERFHADPLVRSTELLLQERNPIEAPPAHPVTEQVLGARQFRHEEPTGAVRHFTTPHTVTPRTQLLSNGRYSLMVTNAGGSASWWRGLAVTRWREDVTCDGWGVFLYVRDVRTGEVWSATYHPTRQPARHYEVFFTEDKAEFQRRDHGILSRLEIAVSPEDDVEVRRLTLTNTTDTPREIEVTSYAEIVLAPARADLAHRVFSNLFVETEWREDRTALLASRRPRSADQPRVWAMHVVAHQGVPAEIWGETEYETDRARFLGRGRTPANPRALAGNDRLSGTTGPVLEPIFALRQRVWIEPHQSVQMAFTLGVADRREEALRLADRYHDLRHVARTFELAWTQSQVELYQSNLTPDEASLFQRLGSRLLYWDSFVRPPAETLARNTLGQAGLWPYGISGDLPIVLAQVSAFDHLALVRQLLVAHEHLRRKGLAFDLVIMNEHPPGYLQLFDEALHEAARSEGAALDQPGGVFIRRADRMPEVGRHLLQFVARAVFHGDQGSLADQLSWRPEPRLLPEEFEPARQPFPPQPLPRPELTLQFGHRYGGFSPDGREYRIVLAGDEWPPAPWANVVANPRCGFVATEASPGFTWCDNSHENRLTPWHNDPVSDPPGEVIYLRHEETGRFWSVTPSPARGSNPYVVAHGAGYTRYTHTSHGIAQELLVFVPPDDPVKLFRLRLQNTSDREQLLSATFYAEWVLGENRERTQAYLTTGFDPETGALLARNVYHPDYPQRVAFADVNRGPRMWTCDRTEFIGRNGSLAAPRALLRAGLGQAAGPKLDACAALQVPLRVPPRGSVEIVFTLGEGDDLDHARALVTKYRDPAAVAAAFAAVERMWDELLGKIEVATPDPAFDLLINRWLLYQTLSCRIWGRSAFYQSGGAYGFRDQLQDAMALVTSGGASARQIARQHLLLAASRQFVEGDVQHWWHPPSGRGVRSRCSDDLLWLPFATLHYIEWTGDAAILDEPVPFLLGRPLAEGEGEYYDAPAVTDERATLYEHCVRAIERGLTAGPHGLPLIGTCDWNDGFNRVGHQGRGESVWLGWFLCRLLRDFAPVCAARGDAERAARYEAAERQLREAIEREAWDGEWYRRAYFDDGTPLGSATNDECRIDSLAQSWAVISGAADPERARRAMQAVERHLVREQDRLVLLFTPPFDRSALDPGYVKGYVPGVRENGGQYTHAALWVVMATALLGDGDRAYRLYSLLHPIRHAETDEGVARYRVEPYVVAADVYGAPPHTGRGGWTWYTGSAGWMYRIGLEYLLGFRREGERFTLVPCVPRSWREYRLTYRYGTARYRITVENPDGIAGGPVAITLDGERVADGWVPLIDDGREHEVRVRLLAPAYRQQ